MVNGFPSCLFLLFCLFISIPCFPSYKSFIKKWELNPELQCHLSYALAWLNYLPGGLRAWSCSACHPSRKNKSCFSGKRLILQSTRSQPVRLQPSTWPLIQEEQTAHVPSGTDPTGTSSRCGETSVPPFANPHSISSLYIHTCAIPTFPTNPYDTCLAPS